VSAVLWMAVIALVAGRVIVFVDFLVRCAILTKEAGLRHPRDWKDCVTATMAMLFGGGDSAHEDYLSHEDRGVESMLVVGSIALAGWSQLYVAAGSQPANELAGVTVGLLFAGSAALLIAPVLSGPRAVYLSRLGRRSGFLVGYGMVALSLASAIHLAAPPALQWLGFGVVGLLIVKQWPEARADIALHRLMRHPIAAQQPSAAPTKRRSSMSLGSRSPSIRQRPSAPR